MNKKILIIITVLVLLLAGFFVIRERNSVKEESQDNYETAKVEENKPEVTQPEKEEETPASETKEEPKAEVELRPDGFVKHEVLRDDIDYSHKVFTTKAVLEESGRNDVEVENAIFLDDVKDFRAVHYAPHLMLYTGPGGPLLFNRDEKTVEEYKWPQPDVTDFISKEEFLAKLKHLEGKSATPRSQFPLAVLNGRTLDTLKDKFISDFYNSGDDINNILFLESMVRIDVFEFNTGEAIVAMRREDKDYFFFYKEGRKKYEENFIATSELTYSEFMRGIGTTFDMVNYGGF